MMAGMDEVQSSSEMEEHEEEGSSENRDEYEEDASALLRCGLSAGALRRSPPGLRDAC